MPKAKRYKGRRLTRQPTPQKRPRKKEDGRPKGTLKRFKFEETKLGFFLKYECPAIYEVLVRMFGSGNTFQPRAEMIELVCKNSSDPSLRKEKFTRYLDEYRKTGLYCRRAQKLTPKREVYYRRIRQKKMNKYIQSNRGKIAYFSNKSWYV